MLRSFLNSYVSVRKLVYSPLGNASLQHSTWNSMASISRCFSAFTTKDSLAGCLGTNHHTSLRVMQNPPSLVKVPNIAPLILQQQSRTVVKFTIGKGKRRSVRSVLAKFKRLDWGIWIRRMAGAHKKLWRKNCNRKMRLERHVFCNATQSYMLDKMVTPYWRTPKYWVDDPYAPYHQREEFSMTRKKPRPLPPHVSFEKNH